MKCSVIKKYLIQEWEPLHEIYPEVREHLKNCPSCFEIHYQIGQALEMLKLPNVVPTPEFSAAWRNRIREEAAKSETVSLKKRYRAFCLKPVYYMIVIAAVIGIGWFGLHYDKRQPESEISKITAIKAQQSAALKKMASVPDVSYQLRVVAIGPKSNEVQRVIRNFRRSHENDIVFSAPKEDQEWTTLKKLSFQAADALRTELERLGAKVELTKIDHQ